MKYKMAVRLRQIVSRLMGWVKSVKKEIAFVKEKYHSIADIEKITYQLDHFYIAGNRFRFLTIFGKPFWFADWQFDSVFLTKQGFGDCNSIHRLYQVFWYNQGLESYLVNIFGSKMGHAVNIIKNGNEYGLCDYSQTFFYPTYSECIQKVKDKYPMIGEIKGIVIQDMNWKIIKRI